jgi:ubiquinone/menaquinone biosynthesis C-methylase UbiE
VTNNFNYIAPVYDRLAALVFGKSLRQAQSFYLSRIPRGAKVLIIGGGSGWILEQVVLHTTGVTIDYVEASERMLTLSKRRVAPEASITFVHGTEESIPGAGYDCIITNFFLDVFPANRLSTVISHLAQRLNAQGVWLCTDFRNTGRLNHRLLLWTMHTFFKLCAGLESGKLSDFRSYFSGQGLTLTEERLLRKGLVFSAVYKKPSQQ